jgi:hypothetical protein
MSWLTRCRTLAHAGLLAALLIATGVDLAQAAAIVTTGDGGSDQVLIYPTPNADSPNPTAIPVTGLPADANPKGVSCFGADTCLVADSGKKRVHVVRVSSATVVDTISTASVNYTGAGTLAVNPQGSHALAIDPFAFSGQLTVITAPFTSAGATVSAIPVAGAVLAGGTQSIVFAPNGTAFVCTGGSIVVLPHPYIGVTPTVMQLPTGCGNLAITSDGNALLAPNGTTVRIFSAPFSAASTPVTLNVPGADSLVAATVTPDNLKALVLDASGKAIFAVSAPFTSSSTVEQITFQGIFPHLQQIAVSPDNTLAIATGGGTNQLIPFVRPPFAAGAANAFDVFIPGGSGLGGVTFLGPAGPPGPPTPCGPIATAATLAAFELTLPVQGIGPVPLAAAVLPSSRSVRVGCAASAFITIINGGTETAVGVGIAPATSLPAEFFYQQTDPATNQPIPGTANTPANIPPGQFQTYVIALTPRAAIDPTEVFFNYFGVNTTPPQAFPGINTLLISASPTPVPDLVALAAVASGNGIADIPGPNGTGAFAVASVNVGAGGSITVSADTGGVPLPLAVAVCQTDASSNCAQQPAPSVTTFIAGGGTPTFSFFVMGGGTIPLDPGKNRVFVRFVDAGNHARLDERGDSNHPIALGRRAKVRRRPGA